MATHDLVVEGIEVPRDININFIDGKFSSFALDGQEAIVSGIHFYILGNIGFYSDYERGTRKDNIKITMTGTFLPDYVTLADSTLFEVSQFSGRLFILDNGRWKLDCSSNFNLAAMRPGETEYTRYSSITFEKDWGAFISGEIFEEQQ